MGRRVWDKKDVNNFVSAESGVGAVIAPVDYAQLPDARRKSLFRICIASVRLLALGLSRPGPSQRGRTQ
jgi:hypothetical protein